MISVASRYQSHADLAVVHVKHTALIIYRRARGLRNRLTFFEELSPLNILEMNVRNGLRGENKGITLSTLSTEELRNHFARLSFQPRTVGGQKHSAAAGSRHDSTNPLLSMLLESRYYTYSEGAYS